MRAAGFTLIELIVIIVFISIALVSIGGLFHSSQTAAGDTADMQKVAQYLQECSEKVMGTRRDLGIDSTSLTNSMCSAAPETGVSRTVSGTTAYSAASPCPASTNCKLVTVTVTKGSMSAAATILLVDY